MRLQMISGICLVLLGLASSSVTDDSKSSQTIWDVDSLMDPKVTNETCGTRENLVCDPTGIFNATEEKNLVDVLNSLAKSTVCPCRSCYASSDGYVFTVVAVPHIRIPVGSTEGEAVRNTAITLRQAWTLGPCGNTGIVLISVQQRYVFTSTGPATRTRMSNDCVDEAFDNEAKKFLVKDEWQLGTSALLLKYKEFLVEGCSRGGGMSGGMIALTVFLTVTLGLGGIGIICACCGCCPRGRGGGGSSRSNRSWHPTFFDGDSSGGGGGGGGGWFGGDGGGGGGGSF